LKILCKIKLNGPSDELQSEIDAFPKSFPDSPLIPLINDLSAALKNVKTSKETPEETLPSAASTEGNSQQPILEEEDLPPSKP